MTEQVIKKPRIFQIAKELNISHTEIMNFLERGGITVTSHMSPIEPDVYERILGEFAKEKVIVDRQRKEMARQDAARTRRRATSTKGRFDRILSIDEQRKIEEEVQRKKEEEINKQLALEELKRQKEAAKATEEEREKAAAATAATPVDEEKKLRKTGKKAPAPAKTKLKRIDIREIEGKIAQGRKKPAAAKDKREVTDAKAKSIEQTLRQTLASMSTRERRRKTQRREKVVDEAAAAPVEQRLKIKIHKFMSVSELAAAMDVSSMDVISSCMQLGIMATINQRLDLETPGLGRRYR